MKVVAMVDVRVDETVVWKVVWRVYKKVDSTDEKRVA